jgi:hypothetical protein
MMMSDPKPASEDEGGEEDKNEPAGDPAPEKPEQEAAKTEEKEQAQTEKKSEEGDPRRKWNRASRELRPQSKEPGYQTR